MKKTKALCIPILVLTIAGGIFSCISSYIFTLYMGSVISPAVNSLITIGVLVPFLIFLKKDSAPYKTLKLHLWLCLANCIYGLLSSGYSAFNVIAPMFSSEYGAYYSTTSTFVTVFNYASAIIIEICELIALILMLKSCTYSAKQFLTGLIMKTVSFGFSVSLNIMSILSTSRIALSGLVERYSAYWPFIVISTVCSLAANVLILVGLYILFFGTNRIRHRMGTQGAPVEEEGIEKSEE